MPVYIKKKPRRVQKIIISAIFLYFIIFTINYTLIASSLAQTLGRIRIPHDYFLISLDPENPFLEATYVVPNENFYDFTDLSLNLSIDIEYEENVSFSLVKERIFSKQIEFNVPPFTSIYEIFRGGNESFEIGRLEKYYNTVVNMTETNLYFDIQILGTYCLGMVPFYIKIHDFVLGAENDCPTCPR